MTTSLNIFESVYKLTDTESVCTGNLMMLKVVVKRWAHNRPEDDTRVEEIAREIDHSRRVDGLISLAVTDEGIVCWDGLHRFKALCRVPNPPTNVLYHVWMNPSEDELKQRFISINKSVAVPSLYIDKTSPSFKRNCEQIMKNCIYLYKDHFSSSARPIEPNVNRDVFLEFVSDFLVEHPTMESGSFIRLLREANQRIAASDLTKVKPKILEKCQKTQCYLFLKHVGLRQILSSVMNEATPFD